MNLFRLAVRIARRAQRLHLQSAVEPVGDSRSNTTRAIPRGEPGPDEVEILRGRAWVIDGDTIVIRGMHIRLAGIDAPELDHPYGQKAKWAMVSMCRGQIVTARLLGDFSHNRHVAVCTLPDGRDLGAELVRIGLAVDWPKYSGGRYRALEPSDVRHRLWRCDARQKGRMPG